MVTSAPTGIFAKPVPVAVQQSLQKTANDLHGVFRDMDGISSAIQLDVVTNGQEYTPAYANAMLGKATDNAAKVFESAPAALAALKPFLSADAAHQFGDGGAAMFTQAAAGVRELVSMTDPTKVSARANGFAVGADQFAGRVTGLLELAAVRGTE